MEFISNQFAKKVKCTDEYKISCAFFNVIKERKFTDGGISGILFPTVEWEKNDVNIALTSECVDKHLSLNQVAEFMINIENDKNGIVQIGTSDCEKFKMRNLII